MLGSGGLAVAWHLDRLDAVAEVVYLVEDMTGTLGKVALKVSSCFRTSNG